MAHLTLQIERSRPPRSTARIIRGRLRDGDGGTRATLEALVELAREDIRSAEVAHTLFRHVLRGGARRARPSTNVRTLFEFSRDRVRYRRDPPGVERVADFLTTYQLGWGDCSDKSEVLAVGLRLLGYHPYFIVMASRHLNENEWDYSHLYVGLGEGATRLALDPTPQNAPLGWEAPAAARRRFDIFDS